MAVTQNDVNELIAWIRRYFRDNGPNAPVVIGISGGKDSTVAAAALVAAVGVDRVLGIMMPDGIQSDLNSAIAVCDFLKIKRLTLNIENITRAQRNLLVNTGMKDLLLPNNTVLYNNPSRVRMVMLYYLANQIGGRVCNTCNLSESYVGYDTKWGDQCGDFSPLQNFTATEVKEIGYLLGLPAQLVEKAPSDGMCGQTDEDRWGFTYQELDNYLRGVELPYEPVRAKIEQMHRMAKHKLIIDMPAFPYTTPTSRNLR